MLHVHYCFPFSSIFIAIEAYKLTDATKIHRLFHNNKNKHLIERAVNGKTR